VTEHTARILLIDEISEEISLSPHDGKISSKIYRLLNHTYRVFSVEELKDRTQYQIIANNRVEGSFSTFGIEGPSSVVVVSCDGRTLYGKNKDYNVERPWKFVRELCESEKAQMIIHLGDNVYMDGLFQEIYIRIDTNKEDITDSQILEEIIIFYSKIWSDQDKAYVLSHMSNLMVLDDHEFIDDFGAFENCVMMNQKKTENLLAWWRIVIQCKRVFMFQQYLLYSDFDEKVIESNEQLTYYPLHKFLEFGNLGIVIDDSRTFRRWSWHYLLHAVKPEPKGHHHSLYDPENPKLGSVQFEDLLSQVEKSNCKSLCIALSTPLCGYSPAAVSIFTKVHDYLRDQWTYDKASEGEREKIIDRIFSCLRRMNLDSAIVLGGDVHFSYHATIFDKEHHSDRFIRVLVTSPVTTLPVLPEDDLQDDAGSVIFKLLADRHAGPFKVNVEEKVSTYNLGFIRQDTEGKIKEMSIVDNNLRKTFRREK